MDTVTDCNFSKALFDLNHNAVFCRFLSYKEKLNYETLGIRIPKNNFCLEIIKKLNRPITSTSANITGSTFPIKNTDIDKNIIDGVDYYVESIRSDKQIPSKIIKVLNENNFEIIRS